MPINRATKVQTYLKLPTVQCSGQG
uniref:Uncharacterized protein n=1 Tax=Arundo donax TaxID=35708 RepID=A0A0A8Y8H5_ARUDO